MKGWMELSRGWFPPLLGKLKNLSYHIIPNFSCRNSLEKSIFYCYMIGMIGIGEPAHLTETTGALHAFNIPLVSVVPPRTSSPLTSSSSGNQIRSSYSNMLTTAPDMAGQARV